MKNFILSLFVLLTFAGCDKAESVKDLKVRYGTSFGMCLGYCKKELLVTKEEMQFTASGRDLNSGGVKELEPKICKADISEHEWNALISTIDEHKFQSLNEVIGCPDCADGGAEWLELEIKGKKHKVTFEFGHEPQEIRETILKLRQYSNSFESCK